MLAAAFRGDSEGIKWHLDEGGDINYPDGKWGTTPLMAAAAPTQRLEVLTVLLRRKDLNKDAVNKKGMTALHQAAWYGQKEAVYLLLTMGASEDPKTEDGYTAAQLANMMGHKQTAEIFRAAEEEREKSKIETADALRARLKSQHKQRSAKLLVPALPPPLPLYKPDPPAAPPAAPPAPEPEPRLVEAPLPAPKEEEVKRQQFEGAGGGGPMKKWAHGVENEDTKQKSRTVPTEAPKRVPSGRSGPRPKGPTAAEASPSQGSAVLSGERTVHRDMPAVLAAEALGEQQSSRPAAGRKRLNMGKQYEATHTPASGDPNPAAAASGDGVQRARAQSSLQLSTDSDWEGSFFLTQKPPSRPASGSVRREVKS